MQHLEVSCAVRPIQWPLGVKWLTHLLDLALNTALFFYLQEYNNPEHLPLRTTALTHVDGDIRTRAHKLCCEYLRGAWKRTTAQDIVIRKIRYVCAPHIITDIFFLRKIVTQNCMQASSLSEASLRISKFVNRGGPQKCWFYTLPNKNPSA